MKYVILVALLIGCGDDIERQYTWGDTAHSLSEMFCSASAECSGSEVDAYCIDHNSWHLCVPDNTCNVPVDEITAAKVLDNCRSALEQMDTGECLLLLIYGFIPEECGPVWDLQPDPTEGDQV